MKYLHITFRCHDAFVYQSETNSAAYDINFQSASVADITQLITQIKTDFPDVSGGTLNWPQHHYSRYGGWQTPAGEVIEVEKLFCEHFNAPFVQAETLADTRPETLQKALDEKAQAMCWTLEYLGYPAGKKEYSIESLLTVANGYLGLRGALPEMRASDNAYPATYLAGLYNQVESQVAGHSVVNEDFVNAPAAQYISLRIGDGDFIALDRYFVVALCRRLDLRTGLLSSFLTLEDAHGRQLEITSRRIANMARMTHYAIEYQFCPLNFSERITVCTQTDGTTFNYNVERYRSLSRHHYQVTELSAEKNRTRLLAKTHQSAIGIGVASAISGDFFHSDDVSNQIDDAKISQFVSVDAQQGKRYTLQKSVALSLSTVFEENWPAVAQWELPSFSAQYDESRLAWQELWAQSDIQLTGDLMTQKLLRLHTYHLLSSCSPFSNGDRALDVSVTARGLHGEAYRGHIFWDEIFILPFYVMHFPETARQLLLYRYHRLPAAKQAAQQQGERGALFPWQSGHDGSEQTQTMHLNPLNGEWHPDHSHLQRHVSLAIAYNVWLYWLNSDDQQFMNAYGAEMLLEIASFWLGKTQLGSDGRYHIDGVMGPDEFHEHQPGSEKGGLKDNAYTNLMVAWLFEQVENLQLTLEPEVLAPLLSKVDIAPDFYAQIAKVRNNLALSINDEHIIAQFDGYFDLKELDWAAYKARYGNIYRMDRILRDEGKSPDEYKVAKQADALMIYNNFCPKTVGQLLTNLRYDMPEDYAEKNLRYYLARTSHGSTLSRIVHAWLAENIQLHSLAWQLYQEALYSDYRDIQGGTTAEGIHTGVMAATLNVTVMAYAGIDIRHNLLHINPALPPQWQDLRLALTHRGIDYRFIITHNHIEISASEHCYVLIGDQEHPIFTDQPLTIPYCTKAIA